jgi:hypothetical protein
MYSRTRLLLGAIFVLAACAQEAVWKSACGCIFNLSSDDKARAQIVALGGDFPAMEALQKHFDGNGPDDEELLWDARVVDRPRFATMVAAANKRAAELRLPSLASTVVAQWRLKGERGDQQAVTWMASYLTAIGMADEAPVWNARMDSLTRLDSKVGQVERGIHRAETEERWAVRAPLIESSLERIRLLREANEWLPYDALQFSVHKRRLNDLIKLRYGTDKASLSYDMCMSAGLAEPYRFQNGSLSHGVFDCDYAKGKYPAIPLK